jgi:hypothetical protein
MFAIVVEVVEVVKKREEMKSSEEYRKMRVGKSGIYMRLSRKSAVERSECLMAC